MTFILYVLNISLIRNVHKKQMSDSFTVSGKKNKCTIAILLEINILIYIYLYIFTIYYFQSGGNLNNLIAGA